MTPPIQRARISLEGLSVADSLGGFFEFNRGNNLAFVRERRVPEVQWRYTDDTNMALSIYEILWRFGEIDQDELAKSFAQHFDRRRGYGMGARTLMGQIQLGMPWRKMSKDLFHGTGSFGNGGAMRVAPLGAYFADDLDRVKQQAALSAEITHAHPEGIAGAIAVAVAAAIAWNLRGQSKPSRQDFIAAILPHIPASDVRDGVQAAHDLPPNTSLRDAVKALGNGSRVIAQDTVPFTLWSAGEYLDDYTEAIWQTISAGGDADTTAAIVGGIVACYVGTEGIPQKWIDHREPLPEWALGEME